MKKISVLLTASFWVSFFCTAQNTAPALPSSILFERQVVQQSNDEDGTPTTTYYFTVNGDYAMIKRSEPGEDMTTILYTKDGQTCMIDEKNKTITIMSMPKFVSEGAKIGKEIAEKINKKPLTKDAEEKITVTKTGKTKTICGYTAYEYEIKNEGGSSSWWYAKVDFDPIKIYTMGAGNSAAAAKLKDADALKNNPAAIPLLNKNYLWAEAEASGKKGMETKSISKTSFSFSTEGYTMKSFAHKALKDVLKAKLKSLK